MPNKTKNSSLKLNAQNLRKSMTHEEKKLWYDFLSKLPITINRQKVICNYIVDFYCASAKLVIEIDGCQHFEEQAAKKDSMRDTTLNELGITVMRIKNKQINEDFRFVCDNIYRFIFGDDN